MSAALYQFLAEPHPLDGRPSARCAFPAPAGEGAAGEGAAGEGAAEICCAGGEDCSAKIGFLERILRPYCYG